MVCADLLGCGREMERVSERERESHVAGSALLLMSFSRHCIDPNFISAIYMVSGAQEFHQRIWISILWRGPSPICYL
jgi:hypothetical protein